MINFKLVCYLVALHLFQNINPTFLIFLWHKFALGFAMLRTLHTKFKLIFLTIPSYFLYYIFMTTWSAHDIGHDAPPLSPSNIYSATSRVALSLSLSHLPVQNSSLPLSRCFKSPNDRSHILYLMLHETANMFPVSILV